MKSIREIVESHIKEEYWCKNETETSCFEDGFDTEVDVDAMVKELELDFSGMIDKNGKKGYVGDVVALNVRRLSRSPWWTETTKDDGYEDREGAPYIVHKKIVKKLNSKGMFEYKLVSVDATRDQEMEICKTRGLEKLERTLDDHNYRPERIEIIK